MKNRKAFGFLAAGLVAGLVLGTIGIATAATSSKSATTSVDTTTSARSADAIGGPGGRDGGPGGHGARGPRGGGALGEALADLTDTDVEAIMTKRAAGTSFAAQAKAAGISTSTLITKATALEKAELDAAVKAGTMTAAQRTELLKNMKAHLTEELTETHAIGGPGGRDGGPGGHGARGPRGGGALGEALADLTDTDVEAIMTKRAAGTSFAAQAKAAGISTSTLITKATALEKAELDAAVKAGTMTAAQRTELLKNMKAHLTEELTETHAIGGPGGRDGGPGGRSGSDRNFVQRANSKSKYRTIMHAVDPRHPPRATHVSAGKREPGRSARQPGLSPFLATWLTRSIKDR